MRSTYRLPLAEQETTVTMIRAEHTASIYTSDRLVMARLDKLCAEFPETYKCIWVDTQIMGDGLPMSKKYEAHKKYVKFRRPVSQAVIERNARARANRSIPSENDA